MWCKNLVTLLNSVAKSLTLRSWKLKDYDPDGPCHGDDLVFLFKANYHGLNDSILLNSEKDISLSKKMVYMWINFAKVQCQKI